MSENKLRFISEWLTNQAAISALASTPPNELSDILQRLPCASQLLSDNISYHEVSELISNIDEGLLIQMQRIIVSYNLLH